MMWIVAKAEFRFNKEQDESECRAYEAVQVCRTEIEADQAAEIFNAICDNKFDYIVINDSQIGEWIR